MFKKLHAAHTTLHYFSLAISLTLVEYYTFFVKRTLTGLLLYLLDEFIQSVAYIENYHTKETSKETTS